MSFQGSATSSGRTGRISAMVANDESSPSPSPKSAWNSPRNRVKFLCSHGGRILPRPSDGQLKYVGGETRVIAVPRDVSFCDLMKKLTKLFEANVVLKYQIQPEDLDALVSVTSDEDLRHMMEEHDRYERQEGTPRIRTFLFSSRPHALELRYSSSMSDLHHLSEHRYRENLADAHSLEQRYIDAINGVRGARQASLMSSTCSSPKSSLPDCPFLSDHDHDHDHEPLSPSSVVPKPIELQRVHSSPNLLQGWHQMSTGCVSLAYHPPRWHGNQGGSANFYNNNYRGYSGGGGSTAGKVHRMCYLNNGYARAPTHPASRYYYSPFAQQQRCHEDPGCAHPVEKGCWYRGSGEGDDLPHGSLHGRKGVM
ncbi:uncharacterized protein LOC18448453 isoform X2 [Amborella trichopoda]|uniref:uncharacterized protein LOC18448453 isoform X2 n=1 Tax=Amborella trichopoda TaxID=13333 RepID=UPI0009BE9372|nr:uncharacterized protein LOC18448453 isoform X2 [Amborella trichopoda]|eukprot:XP_020531772.1 uncharacterized protein LOC18448453 isoform X2 [Amborella trichopoda]